LTEELKAGKVSLTYLWGVDMKDRIYSDWFGSGNTNEDVKKQISEHGEPISVFYESNGFMAALVYSDKVICVGYDGGEYKHKFIMDEK